MKNEQKCDPRCVHPLLTRIGIHSFDRVGIWVSGMCIVHCLFTSVALVALPFLSLGGIARQTVPLGGILLSEELHHWVHPILALVIVPVTLLAMGSGFQRFAARQHRKLLVLIPLGLGLIIVLTVSLFIHDDLHPVVEAEFSFLGGVLLIIGHWWNRQASK